MQELKDNILDAVIKKGPILPSHLARQIKSDLLFTSAILSELVSIKKILISHAIIGSSPVYYIESQRGKLELLYDYLPIKEKEAYDLLKKHKVLNDSKLISSHRVAIRELKDFAIPLRINMNGNQQLFWKWFMTGNDEVKSILTGSPKISIPAKKIEQKKSENLLEKPLEKIKEKVIKKLRKKRSIVEDNFLPQVESYLVSNKMKVIKQKIIKKNREIELIVEVPSQVGDLRFFVKAVNKKKISDGDLSLASEKGQARKLGVLFLSSGELTKKAKEYMNRLKGSIVVKKI